MLCWRRVRSAALGSRQRQPRGLEQKLRAQFSEWPSSSPPGSFLIGPWSCGRCLRAGIPRKGGAGLRPASSPPIWRVKIDAKSKCRWRESLTPRDCKRWWDMLLQHAIRFRQASSISCFRRTACALPVPFTRHRGLCLAPADPAEKKPVGLKFSCSPPVGSKFKFD